VDVNDAPDSLLLVVHLGFSSFGGNGGAVLLRCVECPCHFRPGGVCVNVDDRLMQNEFAFRKHVAHGADVDLVRNLLKTVRCAERKNEGYCGIVRPDLRRKGDIGVVDGSGVLLQNRFDLLSVASGSLGGGSCAWNKQNQDG